MENQQEFEYLNDDILNEFEEPLATDYTQKQSSEETYEN